jgi:chromatin remodeling complex protein RSC6
MPLHAFCAIHALPPPRGHAPRAQSCRQQHPAVTALRRGTIRNRPIPAPEYGSNNAGGSGVGNSPQDPASSGPPSPPSLAREAEPRAGRGAMNVAAGSGGAPAVRATVGGTAVGAPKARTRKRMGGEAVASSLVPAESADNDDAEFEPVRKTGFNSPVIVSRELADLTLRGKRVMTRPQAASGIATYAADRGLGCKDDGRFFTLDAALRSLFPDAPERVKFSALTSLIRPHVVAPSACADKTLARTAAAQWVDYISAPEQARRVTHKVDRRGRHSVVFQKKMRAAGRGLFVPVSMSAVLAKICKEDKPISRPQITKLVWVHIRSLGLQDKHDRRLVHTDPLLKELCGGKLDAVDCFELSKHIARNVTALEDFSGTVAKPSRATVSS